MLLRFLGHKIRYSCLLNDLEQHSIVFEDEYVVETFLNSLPRQWSLISMVIRESKNFKTMSLQTLYGKLWSHEIRNEMTKLSVIQPCHGSECRKKQTENKVVVKDEGWARLSSTYL
ncbi:hypothetical protein Ccrd_017797 [Cynara cardunculus var. scolymus]|uniref:Uncharacterized protein n=1 Tax=Cynara cardunculus var. scolymus TaxID=59895 RepID=A0A118K268_CYNCS|nr:hypothetical protein Ccrd_017797 [Cynara cardunculus var. scolymus]